MFSQYQSMEDESCVSFNYHMYGRGMGSLTIFLRNRQGQRFSVIKRDGNQTRAWKKIELNVPSGEYRLVFIAIRGSDYRSDIAIDDIVWKSGSCFGAAPENPEEEEEEADI